MAAFTLIHGARQVLTLRGPSGPRRGPFLRELGTITDCDVLLRDGVVHAVGPSRQIQNLAPARVAEEIDASGRVVMPAFVDLEAAIVHARPPSRTFDRLFENYGNPDPEVFRDLLADGAKALRSLSSQSLRRRAASIANGMFEHGTGMVEARAGYALDDTGVFKVLRVQNDLKEDVPVDAVSTLLLAPPMGGDPARWARHVIDSLLPNVRRRRLASFVDVEYDSEALPAPIAVHLLETAAELGFGTKLHTGFFSRRSAASLALRTNVLSISGLTAVEEDEANDLASSPVISILKPGVALQTGPGYIAPGRRLVDAGAAIAVAAGYHPELSPGYNDQLTILLATRLYRLRPEEAITAATINAAHAIRAAGTIGSIESGKQADLLILDAPDYRELANYGGVNMVAMMIKKGKVMYSKAASKSEGRGRAGVKERERKPRQ